MRRAAARAAIRRGSSITICRPPPIPAASRARGTRVVLPAPVGATRTADGPSRRAARSGERTSSIGRGSKPWDCSPLPVSGLGLVDLAGVGEDAEALAGGGQAEGLVQ